jgi:hypothetical protein
MDEAGEFSLVWLRCAQPAAAKTAAQCSAPPDQGKFEWQKTGVEPKTRRKV